MNENDIILHQKEDGSVQLRDKVGFFWCRCGKPAVEQIEGEDKPFEFVCAKHLKEDQE